MQVIVSGKEVSLTDAIEAYVQKKVGALDKFFPGLVRAEVVVGEDTKHHVKSETKFYSECKLEVPGMDVFERQTAPTLYEAIDLMKDKLEVELKKHKAKLRSTAKESRKVRRDQKEYTPE